MIVQCPQCSTRFRLDPRRLGDRGAKVTCSVCDHAFVVRADDDFEALDPFSTTSIDNPREGMDDTTDMGSAFGFNAGPSAHDAKTAVHQIPIEIRNRGLPSPADLDETSTLVDLPTQTDGKASTRPATNNDFRLPQTQEVRYDTQRDHLAPLGDDFFPAGLAEEEDATAVSDDDLISIDDDEVMSLDDEGISIAADVDDGESTAVSGYGAAAGRAAAPSYRADEPRVPQFFPAEISRAETAVAQTPSLYVEPRREESAIHRLPPGPGIHGQGTAVAHVPSLSLGRPVNEAHRDVPKAEMLGVATFVGRVDQATMAAAIADAAEPELLMSGGLAADGTYFPPQEPTRPAIVGYGGLGDPLDSGPGKSDNRRPTRQVALSELGQHGHDDTTLRTSTPPEISRMTRFVRGATTVMLSIVLLALSLFALVRSGQLDIEVFRDPASIVRKDGGIEGSSGVAGVQPVALRSVVYPTSRGGQVLVFTGEVKNTGNQAVQNLDVVAELRARDGTVTASSREPLGVMLSVAELARLDDAESVERAFAAKAGTQGSIAAGARVPYMVVIAPAPSDTRFRRHTVHLVQRPTPAVQVTAPALPEPAIAPAPATTTEAQPASDPDDSATRKMKLKAKRMKAKRKAREAGTDEAPAEE